MDQEATSPEHLDIYTPALEWGEGHALRFYVAERLAQPQFSAPTIVVIDSCFTQAVYGQHAERHDERRIHDIQTIHAHNVKLEDDTDLLVLQAYEASKIDIFDTYIHPEDSFQAAQSIAETLIDFFPLGVRTNTGIEALSWSVRCALFTKS